MRVLFIQVIGLLPVLVGLFLIQHAGSNLIEAFQSSSWPSVAGAVIPSGIGPSATVPGQRKSVAISRVEYAYAVMNDIKLLFSLIAASVLAVRGSRMHQSPVTP